MLDVSGLAVGLTLINLDKSPKASCSFIREICTAPQKVHNRSRLANYNYDKEDR